jgi:hypothetical protein
LAKRFRRRLDEHRQPFVGLLRRDAVAVPYGKIEHGLHLVGGAMHENFHRLGETKLMNNIVELV